MLPSANVLLKAAQVSIDEDKPIYLDYYQDSVDLDDFHGDVYADR